MPVNETALRLGSEANLVGIWNSAPAWHVGSEVPAVLWLNAGFVHHVGPFAWYTALARRLATKGVPSLRFDLSGMGDSLPRRDGTWTPDRAVVDVQEAMDWAQQSKGVRRFVLAGICSGAVLAHHAAVRDERVVGAILLDGFGYKTIGYHLRNLGPKLLRWQSWRTLISLGAATLTGRHSERLPSLDELAGTMLFDFPPCRQAEAELGMLSAREVRCLFLYTADQAPLYFNHERQFWEMFPGLAPGRNFEVEFWRDADHLFSAHEQRQRLFERIETWLHPFVRRAVGAETHHNTSRS
jgi:pimeloyl-ACP methyl ester carboxylesterase